MPDLAAAEFGMAGVIELSERYETSLEATGHRLVTVSCEPTLLVVLEVTTKPRDKPGADPKLRVRSSRSNRGFPFVRRHKSVSTGTPLHRALEGEVVHEITTVDEICAEPLRDVEVSAKLIPYGSGNQHLRVIALIRPAQLANRGRR